MEESVGSGGGTGNGAWKSYWAREEGTKGGREERLIYIRALGSVLLYSATYPPTQPFVTWQQEGQISPTRQR